MSNNDLDQAIDLLCMLNLGLTACHLLQDDHRWDDAALIANSILTSSDRASVFKRWADDLVEGQEIIKAINVYLSMGDFVNVIGLLRAQGCSEMAAVLWGECEERGITKKWDGTHKGKLRKRNIL